MRRRTLIYTLIILATAAILFLLLDVQLARNSSLQFGLNTVTNDFGVPLPQLTFTNRLNQSIYVTLETEVLDEHWVKEFGMKSLAIGPRSTGSSPAFAHPTAEGKWRIAITWSKSPPRNRIYFFLARHYPRITEYFEQPHHEFTSPIDAWQPPEVRKAHR